MKIIDIGCGRKKIEGAIGIDNSPFSTADIILNLNTEPLPFENSSIDFVHSSHCLEHLSLEGFLHMLSEMYRVCKDDGTIYITVPYFTTGLNWANPFHNNQICFNEHTFRFFSSAIECPAMSKMDYSTPSCPNYGLKHSANTDSNVEFELLKIDYDYFPEYLGLSSDELRSFRKSKIDVVDAIHFWLKPIKSLTTQTIKKESLLTVDLN
jgi:SAM-dependent methyltransferase